MSRGLHDRGGLRDGFDHRDRGGLRGSGGLFDGNRRRMSVGIHDRGGLRDGFGHRDRGDLRGSGGAREAINWT